MDDRTPLSSRMVVYRHASRAGEHQIPEAQVMARRDSQLAIRR